MILLTSYKVLYLLQNGFKILSHLIMTTAHGPDRKIIIIGPVVVMTLAKQELSCAKGITNLVPDLQATAICLAPPITSSANGTIQACHFSKQ